MRRQARKAPRRVSRTVAALRIIDMRTLIALVATAASLVLPRQAVAQFTTATGQIGTIYVGEFSAPRAVSAPQSADRQPPVQIGLDVGGGPGNKGPAPMVSPHLVVNPVRRLRIEVYVDVVKTEHQSAQTDRVRSALLQLSPVLSQGPRHAFFVTAGVGGWWRASEVVIPGVSHQASVESLNVRWLALSFGAGFQVVLSRRLALIGEGQLMRVAGAPLVRTAIGISIPLGRSFHQP